MKRFIILFLIAILMFTIIGCSSKNEWQEHYDLGVRYLNEGNYNEAIIAFSAAIEIEPNNVSLYENRINAYLCLADESLEKGDYQLANEMYELALLDYEHIKSIGVGTDTSKIKSELDNIVNKINNDQNKEVFVKIINVDSTFVGKEVEYAVTAEYNCPDNKSCVLMIGANTREPDTYEMTGNDVSVSGKGIETIKCSIVPVKWENHDFKLYVNLSAANHEESWTPFASDTYVVGNQNEDVFFSVSNETITMSMVVDNLVPEYTVNKVETETDVLEYGWFIEFTDGTNTYEVGTSHFKFSDSEVKKMSLYDMQTDLWLCDGEGASVINEARISIIGNKIEWSFEVPDEYNFSYDSIQILGSTIQG